MLCLPRLTLATIPECAEEGIARGRFDLDHSRSEIS